MNEEIQLRRDKKTWRKYEKSSNQGEKKHYKKAVNLRPRLT